MSAAAEAFLDELVTWRELAFNICAEAAEGLRPLRIASRLGARDAGSMPRIRVPCLHPGAARTGPTHDPLWNAAQTQLVREGWFHNYMRMLWGKKILEWSRGPREALDSMIELMNKYSLDGRNPNSYSGYFWTLGRYDRPWRPERPIFGTVRYMSSPNAARKLAVKDDVRRYA